MYCFQESYIAEDFGFFLFLLFQKKFALAAFPNKFYEKFPFFFNLIEEENPL